MENLAILENKPDHYYRTEIPNLILDLGLDPFCFTVYAHLKRIAGDDGSCWQTIKNLASHCKMGVTKFKECVKFLRNHPQKLIKINEQKKPDGSPDTNIIFICDIWRNNGDYFREKAKEKPASKIASKPKNKKKKKPKSHSEKGGSRGDRGVDRQATEGQSPSDYKEQPLKKNPFEEQQQHKEEVVVVSSEEENKKRLLLEKYKVSKNKYEFYLSFSLDHLAQALLAYDQYAQKTKLDNPLGCIHNAIVAAWKPNLQKQDDSKEKAAIQEKKSQLIAQNHAIATAAIEKHQKNFDKTKGMTLGNQHLYLRYNNDISPMLLDDPYFNQTLEYYIDRFLL